MDVVDVEIRWDPAVLLRVDLELLSVPHFGALMASPANDCYQRLPTDSGVPAASVVGSTKNKTLIYLCEDDRSTRRHRQILMYYCRGGRL